MKHETLCTDPITCTCISILRDKVKRLEDHISKMSCCCALCTKHNQELNDGKSNTRKTD